MGFSRQEYWSGLPFPPLGDLPNPGIEPSSLMSPVLAGRFFTTSVTWEPRISHYLYIFYYIYYLYIVYICYIYIYYIYIYFLSLEPPSLWSLSPTPLSHSSRWSQDARLGSLCYISTSHYLSVLHMIVYICQCYFLNSSHPLLPRCIHKSNLNVCITIPALQIGSSVPFFQITYIY